MAENWSMSKLQKHAGHLKRDINPDEGLIRFPTPSSNFIFGPPHGLRRGYSVAIGGPKKAGKSYLFHALVGQLHKDYPDAIAIKYDSEFRSEGQLTPEMATMFGVDMDRYIEYQTNKPDEIFDHLSQDVAAECQKGMPLALVGIDSINMIQGIRMVGNDSVMDQTIGDLANTFLTGTKKLLPVQKRHRFAMYYVAQVRDEMDPIKVRQTGNKYRLAIPPAAQHLIDYFIYIERNDTKEGKTDLAGKEYVNDELVDLAGKSEVTGNKVRIKMLESSYGRRGRTGEYTLDISKGLINQYEEIFLLGKHRKIIARPNNLVYEYGGQKWTGQPACLEAIKNSEELQKAILADVFARDTNPQDNDADITSENTEE